MRYVNLTQTIVLLYDGEKMLGQINPGCVSHEISDDQASNSMTIQKFLMKGIIKVFDGKEKAPAVLPKASADSINRPQSGTEGLNVKHPNSPIIRAAPASKNDIQNSPEVQVTKQGGSIVPNIDSLDYVSGIDDGAEMIIKSKADPIGGQAVPLKKIINDGVKKAGKKIKEAVEKSEAEREAKDAARKKLESAPEDIKAFVSKKFMAKKWEILKSTDKEFLKKVAEFDPSVAKIVEQRLTELG